MGARFLEALGLRALHVAASRLCQVEPIPRERPDGIAQSYWASVADEARLYGRLNLGRVAIYLPQLWAVMSAPVPWGMAYILSLCAIHTALALGEGYRAAQAREHAKSAPPGSAPPPPRSASDFGEPFFRPHWFESEALYRAVGVEQFRNFVLWLMRTLARNDVAFVPTGGSSAAVEYERQTRMSETVHWVLAVLSVPLLPATWQAGGGAPFVWSAVIIWGDTMLALLQRYQRLRLWPIVMRARRRAT